MVLGICWSNQPQVSTHVLWNDVGFRSLVIHDPVALSHNLSNYASPMLCNSSVLDYLNMRDEGGLVKGLVKVEIACLGQDKR